MPVKPWPVGESRRQGPPVPSNQSGSSAGFFRLRTIAAECNAVGDEDEPVKAGRSARKRLEAGSSRHNDRRAAGEGGQCRGRQMRKPVAREVAAGPARQSTLPVAEDAAFAKEVPYRAAATRAAMRREETALPSVPNTSRSRSPDWRE